MERIEYVGKALPNYFNILEKRGKPRFKKIRLDKKISQADKILEKCCLCERRCGVNRKEKLGFCKVPASMRVSSFHEHMGEEFFFIPSFTVFFWSCTFQCQFCQNWTISQRIEDGFEISPIDLANTIQEHSNCANMNFVGGEPTPQLPFILKTLKHVKPDMPVVWNSNFYMSKESMSLLKDVIDVYLSDFKYGNDKCALKLSNIPNYTAVVKRNHLLAFKDSELVIRHLVMPGHVKCCTKPVLDFISENFKDKVVVNIMDQYRPCWNAIKNKEINRRITPSEFREAVRYAEKLGLNFIT